MNVFKNGVMAIIYFASLLPSYAAPIDKNEAVAEINDEDRAAAEDAVIEL